MSTVSSSPRRLPEVAVRVIALLSVSYGIVYLAWRITSTLNPDAWVLSLVLLVAEIHGAWTSSLFAFMVWDVRRRPRFQARSGCSVDVFVPTYNEDIEVLEATLAGCQSITYPHTTYVLDDGDRTHVAALAARMGCQYLTRPDNSHAKAGNINAALARTSGEFVVIVDADTVPQPQLVDRTIGYFVDERVALVQLPQEFYNLDSVQHRGKGRPWETWHEQALFFRVIQLGKNRWNAAFWCGSPSIVRRRALADVGGVATGSVTEDLHTSLRLHARGWQTVYHAEALAYGIAPQTLEAFSVQRLRWAQGTMQILRSRENPLIIPGLTLSQRLNYIASTFTYFESLQKLVYLLVPVAVLLTGVLPLRVEAGDYLAHALPFFALAALANVALGRGTFRLVAVEQYNVLKMFLFVRATTLLVWPRALRFKVTPKSADQGVYATERRALWAHFLLLGMVFLSLIVAAVNLAWGIGTGYDRPDLILTTMLWTGANGLLLASGAVMVMRRLYSRQAYRFPIRLATTIHHADRRFMEGYTEDLSRQGCAVVTRTAVPIGSRLLLRVAKPGAPLRLIGSVLRCQALATGEYRLGLKFEDLSEAREARLVEFLFVDAAHNQNPAYGRRHAPPVPAVAAPPPAAPADGADRPALEPVPIAAADLDQAA